MAFELFYKTKTQDLENQSLARKRFMEKYEIVLETSYWSFGCGHPQVTIFVHIDVFLGISTRRRYVKLCALTNG
jgi:hypothetical protein